MTALPLEAMAQQLRHAHANWPRAAPPMSDAEAAERLASARELVEQGAGEATRDLDSAVVVTKAPHAGSEATVVAIVARCLAFGLTVRRVTRKSPGEAEEIAHALYPDVWLNFARLPVASDLWGRLKAIFDRDGYARIFGQRYRREFVVTGHQACIDNSLALNDLMAIWQTGREPLDRASAEAAYGTKGADFLSPGGDDYTWYRGEHPVGIQRVSSSVMAFALRHESLYEGRPTVVLNGHFALLSRLFQSDGARGATVIEVGIGSGHGVRDMRMHLTGDADMPGDCRAGTIRRDAYDGRFDVDAPDTPVTPWANVVHSSDGYLAGATEAARLVGTEPAPRLHRTLLAAGYSQCELEALIASDPVVVADGDEQRLTKRTARMSEERCVATIKRFFPPLGTIGVSSPSRFPLSEILSQSGDVADVVDRPHPEPASRVPPRPPQHISQLPREYEARGERLLADGRVALLVPLAGSGGRFGGYDQPEGSAPRLKPLLPLFRVGGRRCSALDIRCAHARHLRRELGGRVPMLLSCSHLTEPRAREWTAANLDAAATVTRVPEMYRIRLSGREAAREGPSAAAADYIFRDAGGAPLVKPSGSFGVFLAGAGSGVFEQWQREGVEIAVVANSDDVGFRIDRRVLGLLAAEKSLGAVMLTVPVCENDRGTRGGLLRERREGDRWAAYVEEFATLEGASEQLNTNQIYFRLSSLRQAIGDPSHDTGDAVRRRLPLYLEAKQVSIGGERQVSVLHGHQTLADILRIIPRVTALAMSREPGDGQRRGYAPLKLPDDVIDAQRILDFLDPGDELLIT